MLRLKPNRRCDMAAMLLNRKKLLSLAVLLCMSVSSLTAGDSDFDRANLLEHYEKIRLVLVQDSMEGVKASAGVLVDELELLNANLTPETAGISEEHLGSLKTILPEMIGAAKLMRAADSIEEFRKAYYHLSKLMIRWNAWSNSRSKPWVAYCSMVQKSWLQLVPEIGNPYAGQSMPRCGSIVTEGSISNRGSDG